MSSSCASDELVIVRTSECPVDQEVIRVLYAANSLSGGFLAIYCLTKLYPLFRSGNLCVCFVPHTIVLALLTCFASVGVLYAYKAAWLVQISDEDPFEMIIQGTLPSTFAVGIFLFIYNLIVVASSSEVGRHGSMIRQRALKGTKLGMLVATVFGLASFWPALIIDDYMPVGSYVLVFTYVLISGTIIINCTVFTRKTVGILTSALSTTDIDCEGNRKMRKAICRLTFSSRVISAFAANVTVSCSATLLVPLFAENTWLMFGSSYTMGAVLGAAAVRTIRMEPPQNGTALSVLFLTKKSFRASKRGSSFVGSGGKAKSVKRFQVRSTSSNKVSVTPTVSFSNVNE